MSNPIGGLTTQMKLFPHRSKALPNSIICEADIVFMEPKQTKITDLKGFASSHSVQSFGLIPPPFPREPDPAKRIGPIAHTGRFSFLLKYPSPTESNSRTVLNKTPSESTHPERFFCWNNDHASEPSASAMLFGNCVRWMSRASGKSGKVKYSCAGSTRRWGRLSQRE